MLYASRHCCTESNVLPSRCSKSAVFADMRWDDLETTFVTARVTPKAQTWMRVCRNESSSKVFIILAFIWGVNCGVDWVGGWLVNSQFSLLTQFLILSSKLESLRTKRTSHSAVETSESFWPSQNCLHLVRPRLDTLHTCAGRLVVIHLPPSPLHHYSYLYTKRSWLGLFFQLLLFWFRLTCTTLQ